MTSRLHQRIARGWNATLEETLDEIHDDYFRGILTAEQRMNYEMQAFHDHGMKLEKLELVESN